MDELVEGLARSEQLPPESVRAIVYLGAIRDRNLLSLPPGAGIELALGLFAAFSAAEHAALWRRAAGTRLVRVCSSHDESETRAARAAAARAIETRQPVVGPPNRVHAVPLGARPVALVYRCALRDSDACLTYALEAVPSLGILFVLDDLLSRSSDREQSLVESGERRLVRVGFDLHDGPMQDIAALAQEVRLFRTQLGPLLEGHEHREIALGRVDDLEARLVGLDHDVREIARSLQSPTVLRLPFAEALEREVHGFASATRIELSLRATGDLGEMTSSQKIALLRLIQEALSNVREHSGARTVSVRVHGGRAQLTAEVTDDGRGFDVETRIEEAARGGRLGLVGMGERIRLLGGRFDIESAPGGPTRILASIPRWRPLGENADESRS